MRQPSLRHSGLSPRVRGNHWQEQAQIAGERSIPACAGEPVTNNLADQVI